MRLDAREHLVDRDFDVVILIALLVVAHILAFGLHAAS
jgi:hypothetical protein